MHGTKMFYRAGLRLAYEEIGPDAPPAGRVLPVVMLHGMGCNRGLMKGCLEPSFERRAQTACGTAYRRVYVDLPGMGDSNAPLALAGTDAVVEALAAFVRSILEASGGGQFIVTTPYHGYLKNLTIALANKMDYHLSALWEGGHIKFWSRRTLAILLREAGYHHLVFTGAGRIPYLWRHMVFSARV